MQSSKLISSNKTDSEIESEIMLDSDLDKPTKGIITINKLYTSFIK